MGQTTATDPVNGRLRQPPQLDSVGSGLVVPGADGTDMSEDSDLVLPAQSDHILTPGRMIRSIRERTNPAQLQVWGWGATGRHSESTSQVVAAAAIGCSDKTFREVEGDNRPPRKPFLEAFLKVFEASRPEVELLYQLSGLTPPPPAEPFTVTLPMRAILRDLRTLPALIIGPTWQLEECSDALTEMFPPLIPGVNVMEKAMADEEMRRHLPDFEQWALAMLGQFKNTMSLAEMSNAPLEIRRELARVLTVILARNPDARRIWEQANVLIDPDGAVRQVAVADTPGGELHVRSVRMGAWKLDDGQSRLMVFTPLA